MCGIWAIFGLTSCMHSHAASTFSKITHRGPDAWRVEYDKRLKVLYSYVFFMLNWPHCIFEDKEMYTYVTNFS